LYFKSHLFAKLLKQVITAFTSIMEPQLSAEQVASYHENGYLVLRAREHGLVANPTDLKKWAEQVRTWPLEKGKWMPYFEVTASGAKQPMRTENFVDYHSEWKQLICGAGLASILKQLSGQVFSNHPPCTRRKRVGLMLVRT
jgi:hypothetical protein